MTDRQACCGKLFGMSCPHANIVHCPLYEAMHIAGATSCDDGNLGEGDCAVSRGASYSKLVGKLMATHPWIVSENEFEEQAAKLAEQRARNMHLAGVH